MEIFNSFLYSMQNYPLLGHFLVFAIFFLESLVFIGLVVPGTIFLILVGFLFSMGFLDIYVLLVIFAAISLGDFVSFYLGGHGKNFFKEENLVFKLKYLETAEVFFHDHKYKSILLGRFIGLIRPLIPFIAGLFRVDKKKFYILNSASIVLWMALYFSSGFFFGEAFLIIEMWSKRFSYVMVGLVVAVVLLYLYRRFLKDFKKKEQDVRCDQEKIKR